MSSAVAILPSVTNWADSTEGRRDTAQLESRFQSVTESTSKSFVGDIVPPSTESNLLRSITFFVYCFYAWSILLFLLSFFIAASMDYPYGGLNIHDLQISVNGLFIVALFILVPMVRSLAFSWSAKFYHYVVYFVLMEVSTVITLSLFWSAGLPVLVFLVFSGVLNSCIAQRYFLSAFSEAVARVHELAPPKFKKVKDNTVMNPIPGIEDFCRLLGSQDVSPGDMYADRAGIYAGRPQLSHVKALKDCYSQALYAGAGETLVPWERDPKALASLTVLHFFKGALKTLLWSLCSCVVGLWLGQLVHEKFFDDAEDEIEDINPDRKLPIAVEILGLLVLYIAPNVISFAKTKRRLAFALGVAVGEKEWMASDIIRHEGDRHLNDWQGLDFHREGKCNVPHEVRWSYLPFGTELDDINSGTGGGELNLTFMWLCAGFTASRVGASFLSAMCMNIAAESQWMILFLTQKQFKKFNEAAKELRKVDGFHIAIMAIFLFLMGWAFYCGVAPWPLPEENEFYENLVPKGLLKYRKKALAAWAAEVDPLD